MDEEAVEEIKGAGETARAASPCDLIEESKKPGEETMVSRWGAEAEIYATDRNIL